MLRLRNHNGPVLALAFAPDGRQLASVAKRDKHASLWQLPRGECVISPGEGFAMQSLAFAPDGSAIALASGRHVHRWNLAARAVQQWFRGANHVWQAAFSPDGSLLAATCFNRRGEADCFRVDLFRPNEPGAKKTFLVGDYGYPLCLAFSPGGRFLASGCSDKSVRVWSVQEKAKAVSWKCAGKVFAVAFSADESLLVVSAGKALSVYHLETRKPVGELAGHAGEVRALATAPDGTLLSAGDDGTARLWDLASLRERACFDWKIGALSTAAFSPDGALAAVGGEGELVVWDAE